jgi:hypothetical protein
MWKRDAEISRKSTENADGETISPEDFSGAYLIVQSSKNVFYCGRFFPAVA